MLGGTAWPLLNQRDASHITVRARSLQLFSTSSLVLSVCMDSAASAATVFARRVIDPRALRDPVDTSTTHPPCWQNSVSKQMAMGENCAPHLSGRF